MRTIEEVQQDYAKAATVAGDIGYRITTMREDLRKTERRMRALNTEAQGIANAKANAEKEAANGTEEKQSNA
jgi:hypothetical protein